MSHYRVCYSPTMDADTWMRICDRRELEERLEDEYDPEEDEE